MFGEPDEPRLVSMRIVVDPRSALSMSSCPDLDAMPPADLADLPLFLPGLLLGDMLSARSPLPLDVEF